MKLFCGFAVVVASICFCSASQSLSNEQQRITITLDDDLLDRTLTINPNVKYTVQMKSNYLYQDYKLSVSVIIAECSDSSAQVRFRSLSGKDNILDMKKSRVWTCRDTYMENSNWVYDSSTSSLEISVLDMVPDIKLKFLITAYLEIKDGEQLCPVGYIQCSECGNVDDDYSEEDSGEKSGDFLVAQLLDSNKRKSKRCISTDITCNGRDNCPNCAIKDQDESCSLGSCPDDEGCLWSGFHDSQYMLTILLAGLFFIMSPIVIVLVLFYHKSMSPRARQRELLRARERSNAANETITISRGPLRNDRPPAYDDVHDTKTPPPNFDDVVVTETSEVGRTNIPQGISTNV